MIGLVGKNIKNIIIIYAFHMSMKLQKKVNKLHRGMEWDKEKKKKKMCVCIKLQEMQTTVPEINTLKRIKRRLDNTEK